MEKTKGCIYYTDNRLKEPIFSTCQKYMLKSGLPITSCSLKKPINFGNPNVVYQGERSYPTMIAQIILALENSKEDYVFFLEHDLLYPKSHFKFTPPTDNVFYYNENIWRWWIQEDIAIHHNRMLSLSCLCVNRQFALDHYYRRQEKMLEWGLDKFRSREPRLARIWGYEPGAKSMHRGGFSDDKCDVWQSEIPVVDIRHYMTFSSPKIRLESYTHIPQGWLEMNIDEIPGWNLREIFDFNELRSGKKI